MKTKFILSGLAAITVFSLSISAECFAQGKSKDKGKNKGKVKVKEHHQPGPPPWAPAHGYRAKTRHVYFPQHNFYFDVKKNLYHFLSGDKWQVSSLLPAALAGIDLKGAVRRELELDIDTPYLHNTDHKIQFKSDADAAPAKPLDTNRKSTEK